MAGGHSGDSIDVLRKALIIACLVAGMVVLHRFDAPAEEFDPTGMLALGFVILASYTVGELVGVIKLPHITGYLFAGLLLGPSFAHLLPATEQWAPFDHGVLNKEVMEQLGLFNTLALALIAITAGGELKIDGLRKGFMRILGVLGGQSITTFIFVPAFFVAISGAVPGIELEAFSEFGLLGSLAIGMILAAISLATSPAATIAVINETKAKGEVTDTTLATVVLKDVIVVVVFSLMAAIAVSLLGTKATAPGALAQELSWHILGSLGIGAVVGLGMALYLSWVRHEVLLFLVGVVFTAAFAAEQLHLDLALLFIAAGFTASNYSKEGDTLIHEVERLSTPVYVVFFTLAGAHLHLDTLAQMAPYAIALVAVRTIAFYLGVRVGGAVTGASRSMQRFGWMGFISQAGVALTLADLARKVPDATLYPGAGDTFATLVIAGIAIHEVVGPVALKIALGFAGELPKRNVSEDPDDSGSNTDPSNLDDQDLETETVESVSVEPVLHVELGSVSDKLNVVSKEWSDYLQGLVSDVCQGPFTALADDQQNHIKLIRREFLRYHRRLSIVLREPNDQTVDALRAEQQKAAERWRQFTLRRAYDFRTLEWSPMEIVAALDRLVDGLPSRFTVPFEPSTFEGLEGESPFKQLLRLGLRLRRRLSFLMGAPKRTIRYQAIAKYHFSGHGPSQLEAVAAALNHSEHLLVSTTRSLFEQMMGITERFITEHRQGSTEIDDILKQFRHDLEEEFDFAIEEVKRASLESGKRLAHVLGRVQTSFHTDLLRLGTFDLIHWSRRYSRAFSERTRGIHILEKDYPESRSQIGNGLQTLALELELLSFEGFAQSCLEVQAEPLARRVQGNGNLQVQRVLEQLAESIAELEQLLESERNTGALIEGIRTATEPLHRVAVEASDKTESLVLELQSDQVFSILLDQLISGAGSLSESYELPEDTPTTGEWKLANPIQATEIPFRRAMTSIMETSVSRALLDCVNASAHHTKTIFESLSEFERMVPFNRELATGDLGNLETDTVSDEVMVLVREMLIGAFQRSQKRLEQNMTLNSISMDAFMSDLQMATIGPVETLRSELTAGDLKGVSARLKQEASPPRVFGRDGRGISAWLTSVAQRMGRSIATIIGPHRLSIWREQLGLRAPTTERALQAKDFRIDANPERLPLVYRRLFSDRALEAGDLLSGREVEFDAALDTLRGRQGASYRSVALVGPQGVGKRAIVAALSRKFTNIQTIQFDKPCTLEELDQQLNCDGQDTLFLFPKIQWLMSMEPQGTAPLSHLVETIIKDKGKNAFLLVADSPNWAFARQSTSIAHAMAHICEIAPLSVEDLSDTLLTRHAMSGYTLSFPQPSSIPRVVGWLLRRTREQDIHQEQVWFEELHRMSAGIMQDAMAGWLNAIERFDEQSGQMVMGEHGETALNAIDRLPDNLLLTLRAISRQGWMNPEIHASLFRLTIPHSHTVLARLCHFGLLSEQGGRYSLRDRHAGAVYQILEKRGWTV